MGTRSTTSVLTAVCLLLFLLSISTHSSANQVSPTSPSDVVRQFYAWYLHSLTKNNYEPLKQKSTALKYLTAQLYRNAPRLTRRMDADIFICAQDWYPEWEKNFTFSPPTVRGTTANTVVTLSSGADRIRIKVVMKKTNAGWRINQVECAN
jgi:hypothetical protein